ncbi:MAG: hypothetical protein RRB13_01980 [bacterium]|nr:hypothetical protein [bacterium]
MNSIYTPKPWLMGFLLACLLGACSSPGPARLQGPAPIEGPIRLYLRAPAPEVAPLAKPQLRPLPQPSEEP